MARIVFGLRKFSMISSDKNNAVKGFTLVEMLVTVAVSSIVIAGAFASYVMVSKQYQKIKSVSEMHNSGRSVMQVIERDIRMAGFVYRNDQAETVYAPIADPLIIEDSGNQCCDKIIVVYDYHDDAADTTERVQVSYWVEQYTGSKGTRGRMYRQKDVLLPTAQTGSKDVMEDYIEDLQFTTEGSASGANDAGDDKFVKIDLILRTKDEYGLDKQYTKKNYFSGNYVIDKTDSYKRDEFFAVVLVRNLI